MVLQSSWSGCHPVTVENVGSSPIKTAKIGDIAQQVERHPVKVMVVGSSPTVPANKKFSNGNRKYPNKKMQRTR